VTDVTVPKCKLDDEPRANLQTALRAANYTTGVVGKWHLSAEVRGDGAWLPTARTKNDAGRSEP
jgi:arylsulfatase A-like enzyme